MSAVAAGAPQLIALVGNPNCGKTALFNLLTGSRQKVANYAGVTVERKEGVAITPSGKRVRILDLPGLYSLEPATPDEQVTTDVLLGRRDGETKPDAVVCVTDATNLRQNLRLVLALKRLGVPLLLALNMSDLAKGQSARVVGVVASAPDVPADLTRRLADLGFLPGERVHVLARGPLGGEPVAVRVGTATFALRRLEADCIRIAPLE